MGRSPLSDEGAGVKKGPWTPEEDDKLINYIQKHGHGSWRALPRLAGLNRCGKSCRLRWTNYLRPDIKRGKFSQDEEQTILNLHAILGNKWSAIATHLPGRTDNEIKNFWNTHLKKKLIQMGFDPMTHRPRTDIFATLPHLLALASLFDNHPSSTSSWDHLQNLLHPAPSIPNFNNPDFNLFAHLQHQQQPLSLSTADFLHLPELRDPCAVGPAPVCTNAGAMVQGLEFDGLLDNSPPSSSAWVQSPAAAPGNDNSVTNSVDASGYGGGGAQMWRELMELDDSIFQEPLM